MRNFTVLVSLFLSCIYVFANETHKSQHFIKYLSEWCSAEKEKHNCIKTVFTVEDLLEKCLSQYIRESNRSFLEFKKAATKRELREQMALKTRKRQNDRERLKKDPYCENLDPTTNMENYMDCVHSFTPDSLRELEQTICIY